MPNRDFEIDLKMKADFTAATRALRETQGNFEKINKTLAGSNSHFQTLVTHLAKIAVGYAGVNALVTAIGAIARATIESEAAAAKLDAKLRALGDSASATRGQILDMAQHLQGLSTFDDEAITEAATALLNFTRIDTSQFGRALKDSLDLAAASGDDLSSVVEKVGKALNDPVGSMKSLKAAGIALDETQKALIKSLTEAGRNAEAQQVILAELERRYAGAAAAARNTLGGALQGLKNDFENVLEGDTGGEGIKGVTVAINSLAETMRSPEVREGFQAIIQGMASVASYAANAIAQANNFRVAIKDALSPDTDKTTLELLTKQRQLEDDLAGLQQGDWGAVMQLYFGRDVGDVGEVNIRLTESLDQNRKRLQKVLAEVRDLLAQRRTLADPSQVNSAAYIRAGGAVRFEDPPPPSISTKPPPASTGAPKSSGADPEAEAKRALASLQQQIGLLGLVEDGEGKAGEAARVRYEIENGAYKDASAGLKERLLASAQELDAGRSHLDIAKQLKSVDLRVLELQGKGAAAALQEAIEKLEVLRSKLAAEGDTAGVAKIDQSIKMEQDAAALTQLQSEYAAEQDRIAAREQQIQAQRSLGLISEAEAQRRIIDLYRDQGAVLDQLLPKMEAIAGTMGGPAGEAARANLARIRSELEQMQATTGLLQQKAGELFEGSFANALQGLATRAKNLSQAVTGFILDMAHGLSQFASQQLAQALRAKLFSTAGKSAEGVAQGAAISAAAATAAPLLGAAVKIGGSAAASSMGIAISVAGKAAAIAMGAAITTASSAGALADGAGDVAGAFFADGGHVLGPGTSTSDSISARLSNYEFVTRAAVVRQPGALQFLTAFNDHGMEALFDPLRRFDNYGAPSLPSMPSVPRFNFQDGGLAQAAGNNPRRQNLQLNLLLDKDDMARAIAKSSVFEQTVMQVVHLNSGSIRQSLEY
jgi:hypothetical protein